MKGNKTVFTASNINYKDGTYFIDMDGKKKGTSAILTNMLGDIALLIQDTNSKNLISGDKIKVIIP